MNANLISTLNGLFLRSTLLWEMAAESDDRAKGEADEARDRWEDAIEAAQHDNWEDAIAYMGEAKALARGWGDDTLEAEAIRLLEQEQERPAVEEQIRTNLRASLRDLGVSAQVPTIKERRATCLTDYAADVVGDIISGLGLECSSEPEDYWTGETLVPVHIVLW